METNFQYYYCTCISISAIYSTLTCILTCSIKHEKRKQLLYITIMIIISHTNTKLLHIN